ncbi:NAD(P)-dependent oxidoreductase [Alphaproteobacteria bacterium]|jgi:3-hydroxyisobutyrate dehydrogenase|nr:NAD(P)-dependent oxidoreductase [Alphaproteobacteria bacterium]MBT5799552.1 NAD(P)-dependent oxidoreductase [Alphaproteobacteria bacterium]MDA9190571.1 NAD(P)-dependent oxidoreductase [Alphaproteobacteria bacterium]MDA9815640.1 NAD(P)-dependent oxidoreductase [Alphaproteobacteria bacterium]MDC0394687.1 NAD(P)-dependent oxidoreductase [Alphaproteobacteria bacterium]
MLIGLIGVGKMGRAICERLMETGNQLVVWNRSPEKIADLKGVTIASTPAEVAASAEIIISVLANDHATQSVYFEEGGLTSISLQGKLIIEICTSSPERAVELEKAVMDAGGQFLESPVGGTVKPARDGTLLGLVAGDKTAFERGKPILEQLTRRIEYLGAVGSASAMKLAVNLPLMVYWGALGEAVAIAMKKDISAEQAMSILVDSSGAIGAAKMRCQPILDMMQSGESSASNFSMFNAIKDMKLMVGTAQNLGVESPIIDAARRSAEDAAEDGWAAHDASLLAAWRSSKS